jgi:hypothetical protein
MGIWEYLNNNPMIGLLLIAGIAAVGFYAMNRGVKTKWGAIGVHDDGEADSLHSKLDAMAAAMNNIETSVGSIKESHGDIIMAILKENITNKELPPQERVRAYEKYKSKGGNGWVDAYYNKFVKPMLDTSLELRLGGEKPA